MGPIPGVRTPQLCALVVINHIADTLPLDEHHFECDEDGWMADKGTWIVETKGGGGTRGRGVGGGGVEIPRTGVTPWRFYDTRCDRDGQTR